MAMMENVAIDDESLLGEETGAESEVSWPMGLMPPGYNLPPLRGWEKGISKKRGVVTRT